MRKAEANAQISAIRLDDMYGSETDPQVAGTQLNIPVQPGIPAEAIIPEERKKAKRLRKEYEDTMRDRRANGRLVQEVAEFKVQKLKGKNW